MIIKKHRLIQTVCLVTAGVLLWPLPFCIDSAKFIVQLSPFIAICDGIALRSIGIGTGIGLAFAALGVFKRRWFCRYACPMGLLLDGVAHIGLKKTSWWSRCIPLGRYAALLTIAGALAGYPFLLWMDPLAILSSSFAIRTAGSVLAGILAALGIIVLIGLSLTSGAIWCVRLCPLGGTLDLLASIKQLFKKQPDAGVSPELTANSNHVPAFGGRRSFLFVIAGIGIGILAKRIGAARGENAPLRPPGAVAEAIFAGVCLRCGNCVRACPSKVIRHDTGEAGVAGLLAPSISYDENYCLEDCNACTRVCPSGALQELDLQKKRSYVIGEALVDMSLCVLALGERDCDACKRACPFDAVRIHWDEEQYVAYPVIDRKKCNGCGACEVACPALETKAIRVWKNSN
jgi:ferredoxin-type protein NapF